MAGIRGDASIRRCGVRRAKLTQSFESDAGQTDSAGEQLTKIRVLSDDLRVHDASFEKLCWLFKLHLANGKRVAKHFEESCEALISVLYFGLVCHAEDAQNLIQTVWQYFMDKWFIDYDLDIDQLVFDVPQPFQKCSFATTLLLHNHYKSNMAFESYLHILGWPSPELNPPIWLKELTLSPDEPYQNFNRILFNSLNYMNDHEVALDTPEYLQVLCTFFASCRKYKEASYSESIGLLSSLKQENCAPTLLGWNSLICGLSLEHLGKFSAALLKYKEAFEHSPDCYYGLYYSSRILKVKNLHQQQLECLKLLSSVNKEQLSTDRTLQSSLLRCHLPSQEDIIQRMQWLLAASSLINKEWTDLPALFRGLLTNWKEYHCKSTTQNDYLILPSDNLPYLPPKSCIQMGYVASIMFLKESHELELSLEDSLLEDSDLKDMKTMTFTEKVDDICSLTSHLMYAESFYLRGKLDDALSKCGRILTIVEPLYGLSVSWKRIVFSLKGYTYKLLSILHSQNDSRSQNTTHFKRLYNHCLVVLEEFQDSQFSSNSTENLILETIHLILILRTDELVLTV